MKTRIRANNIEGHINMVSSKSLLHRYLILATKSKDTKIYTNKISIDVKTTIDCLKKLGTNIEIKTFDKSNSTYDQIIEVKGAKASHPKTLNMNESGASFRFLLPYTFLEQREVEFIGKGRLPHRPIDELINVLKESNIKFSNNRLPFKASGKLRGSHFTFTGQTSSQYLSAIMLSAALMEQVSTIQILGKMSSKNYIIMTAKCIEDFGVKVEIDESFQNIKIDGRTYKAPNEICIEGEWSNAILPIAIGLMGGEVSIGGLFKCSYQGDINVVDILHSKGAKLIYEDDRLFAYKSDIESFDLDIDDNIDLFPVLSVLAINSKGRSIFRNIERLKEKESNRIESVLKLHQDIGSNAYIEDDAFVVEPSNVNPAQIDSFNDHRIVMAATLASIFTKEIIIDGFEAIEKSYPNYLEDLKLLGFEIEEILWEK